MRHVDPDDLALLALGELGASDSDRAHVADCPDCAAEVANLSRAARVGRSTLGEELLTPAPRVWEKITAELAETPQPGEAAQPPVDLALRRRGRWMPVAIAAAMVGILAAGGLVTWQALRPASPVVLASAVLEAFPDWPDSAGSAVVEETAGGSRVVRVDLEVPEDRDGYTEVWLISSDATRLVSLGTVDGTSGTFTIPSGIDITDYTLVDVSVEPFDGNPEHSGNSIVRGELRA